MCVCCTFRSSDFFTIPKKRIRGGSTYAECNSGSLKDRRLQLWIPHCLSATRRLALNNRGLRNRVSNHTHGVYWIGCGREAGKDRRRTEDGREGTGGEGREQGDGVREQWCEGGWEREYRKGGRVGTGNEWGRNGTMHGRSEGKRGGRKRAEERGSNGERKRSN